MRGLDGKVAIVTGAASGIGRATAKRLAEEGTHVLCADLDAAGAEAAAAALAEVGAVATGLGVDVRSEADTEAMARRALSEFGRIDALFANAGITGSGTVVTTEPDHWDQVLAVNLTGVWLSMRAVLPAMIDQGGGAIVATASIAAIRGYPGNTPYAASKGGVLALVRQAAIEYAAAGVRVNAVAPGAVLTALTHHNFELRGGMAGVAGDDFDAVIDGVRSRHPLGRIGDPADVAALVAFLMSDDGAWITGSMYPVDGGLSAA